MVPLVGQVRGDLLPQLVVVDDEDTVAALIEKVCHHSVGLRVAEREDVGKLLFHEGQQLSHDTTFEQAGIRPMDYVEICFEDDEFAKPPAPAA
jgi:hypothetical protein